MLLVGYEQSNRNSGGRARGNTVLPAWGVFTMGRLGLLGAGGSFPNHFESPLCFQATVGRPVVAWCLWSSTTLIGPVKSWMRRTCGLVFALCIVLAYCQRPKTCRDLDASHGFCLILSEVEDFLRSLRCELIPLCKSEDATEHLP